MAQIFKFLILIAMHNLSIYGADASLPPESTLQRLATVEKSPIFPIPKLSCINNSPELLSRMCFSPLKTPSSQRSPPRLLDGRMGLYWRHHICLRNYDQNISKYIKKHKKNVLLSKESYSVQNCNTQL